MVFIISGLIFSDFSEHSIQVKKHVMNAMKTYGDGLQRLEDVALDVIQDLVKTIEVQNGQPFHALPILRNASLDIVGSIVRSLGLLL